MKFLWYGTNYFLPSGLKQTSMKQAFEALRVQVSKDIPGFEIRYKDEMKLRDWKLWVASKTVGLFNQKFMTEYTTTLYPVVYFSTRDRVEQDYEGAFRTLAHEYVHLSDEHAYRFWFPVSYLMPQILALGSLGAIGAIWNLWFLLCLASLLCLAPWGSPWRSKWEMRGYVMTMFVACCLYKTVTTTLRESVTWNFTNFSYYRMWPDEKEVRRVVNREADLIEAGRDSDFLNSNLRNKVLESFHSQDLHNNKV
jgi:hypothetical protein